MTKEELKQISINNRKLSNLKGRYSTLKYKSLAKGQVLTGMPHVSGTGDSTCDYVVDLAELRNEIALLELTNEMLIKKARRFIADIPDWIIGLIIELKYINNLYSDEIATCIRDKEIKGEKDVNRILKTFFLDQLL